MKTLRLSVMMFLEFMALPVWFVPMFPYVQALPGGADWAVWCGMIMGFGTFTSPLVGMFADRYVNAERMLAACHFAAAALLAGAFFAPSAAALFPLLVLTMCCYMPTWALTATITMAHASKSAFPRIRVFGTLGWVASGVFSFVGAKAFGLVDFDATHWIFASGAAVSLVLGAYALSLPKTEPAARGTPASVADALGLRALVLLRDRTFLAFVLLLLLGMVPFQWYNVYCAAYLKESGFRYLTLTLNLGQVGEIGFMLLVPCIVGRYGYKRAMVIGLATLVFRNVCFLLSSACGRPAFDFGGILVHGLIFGLLIVGSQMYVDEVAPKELRNQAQGLINIVSAGVGVFCSNALFDALLRSAADGSHPWPFAYAVALALSILAAVLMSVCFRPPRRHDKGDMSEFKPDGVNKMRNTIVCAALAAMATAVHGAGVAEKPFFNIRDFGARESDLLQTKAIQSAIDAAAAAGGGEVVIPEGRFRTGGLVLKSGVTLRLSDGAELMGDSNPDNYPGSNRWYRALIRADGAQNVAIVGARHSRLNGVNAYDARGEENYRGPHAIMMIGCTNVTLKGYTIRDSANWAHALFHCANVTVSDVRVFGGHDALDFHDSENVTVERCELRTGDDCVAGFANRHCRVRDCVLDSSCQAVRIGGADILFERCRTVHPASFGHRWNLPPEKKRAGTIDGECCHHGMGRAVIYYCDTRWKIDRSQRDIVFRDCAFAHPRQIFSLTYDGRDMWCCRHPLESILFDRCTFTEVEKPIAIYGDAERPLDFTMRDCTVTAAPGCGGKPLLTAYNYGTITLANLTLKGFSNPHLVTRSKGNVAVTGATPIENRFCPDENDRVLSFAECAAALAKEPADEAAYRAWEAAHPTPPESRWSAEKRLYVTAEDPLVIDVYGSALAVLRNETPHRMEISRSLCSKYQYLVGWGRTGAVAPCLRQGGGLSSLPAGAFGYAMAQFDPLFARTFFTDFVRSPRKTPAAVAGARLALEQITDALRAGF